MSRVRPAGAAARLVVLSLLGLLLAACAAERAASVPEPACTTPGGWFDPATGRGIGEAEVLGRASAARTVLLGEVHDDPDHHAWQLTVASALHAHGRPLVIGVEMLPRSAQPALDAWTAGRSSEAEFLKAVRWTETWGHDPELYLPLFRFARDRHIPMLALNVEQTLVAKVARNGWAAVPVAERQGVGDPAPAAEAYRRSLAEALRRNSPGTGPWPKPSPRARPRAPPLQSSASPGAATSSTAGGSPASSRTWARRSRCCCWRCA
ncbi:MAG: ChaN family lipoprotein, partial [Rhodospirillales bacterium]|nr:ChaN family lipoprotein [Rhodospirillales bacterium]